jgi:hypothetical protein
METWKVKVHPKKPLTYLWGGEKVDEPLDTPLLFTLRVDELGEDITFGRRDNTSNPVKTLGSLQRGESFTVSLKGLRGIWAKCIDAKVDTIVFCSIHESNPL